MANPNFDEFIKRITKDFQTKEIKKDGYDPIKSKEDLEKKKLGKSI
jgi:hypothetical protein